MALQTFHRFGLVSYLAMVALGVGLASSCDSSSSPDDDSDGEEGGSGGQGGKSSTSQGKGGNGGKASATGGSKGNAGNKTGSAGSTSGGSGGSDGAGGKTSSGGAGKGSGSAGAGGKSSGGSAGNSSGAAGSSSGNGGSSGTAGSTGAGGSDNPSGSNIPGYWSTKDWHGCSWTGKGQLGTTTVAPQDFVSKPAADAYCISGVVGKEPDYKSVALLGFNVKEENPTSCAYKPVDTTASGPPAVTTTAKGLAINFVKRGSNTSFTLRVQIQGPNGAKDGTEGENDRWCATLTEVQGKMFVPFDGFYTKCWGETTAEKGNKYNGEPISAVVFSVPGSPVDTPYDFCVNGFTYGSSADEAPDGPVQVGDQKGTIGGDGEDKDFDRVKVVVDGEQYIIQNNNWGGRNDPNSNLTLSYLNNSFKTTQASGNAPGGGVPISFPSIYIGANGNTQNGVMSTKTTDNLPVQISAIKSIKSTFQYSGDTGSSSTNAAYDIWFAKSIPSSAYEDALDGFVMIWLRDPGSEQPIGSKKTTATVAGEQWDVWVGPRGGSRPNSGAPVVSFVNPKQDDDSRAKSFVDKDILEFIKAAKDHGIDSSLYLTDVFAGFEVWRGGSGLSVDKFTCVVEK